MWAAEIKLAKELDLKGHVLHEGTVVTITEGRDEKFALWHFTGIWDLPIEYVGALVRIVSRS